MSLGYAAESNVIGGGFGGWGGGWGGGIAPVGLFGLIGARGFDGDRRDGHCCDGENRLGFDLLSQKMLENNINQNVDTRFNDVNDNLNRNALLEILGGIKGEVCESRHDIATAVCDAKFGLATAIHGVSDNVVQNRFQSALNTKDIISSQKDCCCETKEIIMAEGQATRALIEAIDKQNLRDRNVVLANKLDNCRQTAELEVLRRDFDKQITNVNFGTQQVLTAIQSLVAAGNNA